MNNLLLLNLLHVFNDGFESSFLLLLPFIAKDIHINLAQVGMLGTTSNLVELFIALPAGLLAKRFGGLPVLTIALLIYIAGYAATGIAPTFIILFGTFMIAGAGFGFFHSIAFALIAKWTDNTQRGKYMGNFAAIGDLGRIGISTALTFIIAGIGWRHTTLLYAAIGAVLFTILARFIFKKQTNILTHKTSIPNISTLDLLRHKPFLFANITNLFDTFASSSLFIFLPFLLLKRGINPAILGAFTAIFFIGNFMGKTVLGRFSDKYGAVSVFIVSEVLMAIMIIILANIPSVFAIIISSLVLGVFTKGTTPIVKTLISESAENHGNFEKAFGINSMFATLAVTIAPITLGFISNQFGIISAFNVSAVFALCATIPAIGYKLLQDNGSIK